VATTCECGNEPSGFKKCENFFTGLKPVSFAKAWSLWIKHGSIAGRSDNLKAKHSPQVVHNALHQNVPVPMRATESISQISAPDYHLLRTNRTKQSAQTTSRSVVMVYTLLLNLLNVIRRVVFTFETVGFNTEFVHMLWQFANTLMMVWLPS
jgi:hypothetical protein